MASSKRDRDIFVLKVVASLVVLAILIAATVYLFPIVKNIATPDGQVEFKNTIQNSGFLGALMLFSLDMAQIILAFVPGEPIEVMAGMCYGAIGGTVFILFASFVSSMIIFFAIRKFGHDIVYSFCN